MLKKEQFYLRDKKLDRIDLNIFLNRTENGLHKCSNNFTVRYEKCKKNTCVNVGTSTMPRIFDWKFLPDS